MRKMISSKIVAKDGKAAVDALADTHGFVTSARRQLDKAHAAIGNNTRWAGELSRLHEYLLKCQVYLEDVCEEVRDVERAKRRVESEGQK